MNPRLVCLLLALLPAVAQGGEKSLAVGVNVFKPALGLPNVEFEYGHDARLSFSVFTEALLYRTPLSPPEGAHPDWVTRLGPRYYVFSFQDPFPATGFYGAGALGFAWTRTAGRESAVTVGAELGYKHVFVDHLYVNPRLLITHRFGAVDATPGFELVIGAQL